MTADLPVIDETYATAASEDQLQRAAKGLEERNYTTHLVDSLADARTLMRELLPRDQEIFTANGVTLTVSGIKSDIDESGEFRSLRQRLPELEGDFIAQMIAGAAPDVVVGSVHAVTEDGVMIAASASGSQLASYASGARKAFWVVGAQKVVPDLEAALHRVRAYCLPKEDERLQTALGQNSFIGKMLVFEREAFPHRGTVVLVRETAGF